MARWFGAILVAASLAACGGKDPVKDLPSDVPSDAGDVPIVLPDVPADDGGAVQDLPRDDSTADGTDDGVATDLAIDVAPEAKTDVPCVPDCTNRQCGSDGCDDYCGFCKQGELCTTDGTCELFCRPDCVKENGDPKVCGADGCNGECAPGCADNEECSLSFTCVLKSCVAKCEGRVCGPDSCGGECGTPCGDGQFCTPEGQCTLDTNCYDVTAVGRCVGNELQWCEGGSLQKTTCDTASGLVCGYDTTAKKFLCKTPEVCQPRCTGKECGPDGCNGTCGTCADGLTCSTGGKCGEACPVPFPPEGLCDDFILEFCHQGILLKYDCYAANPPVECRWDPEQSQYNCY